MQGFLDDSLENYFEALRIYQEMIPGAHEDIGVCKSVSLTKTFSTCFFCSAL